jgi:hypothetical protein
LSLWILPLLKCLLLLVQWYCRWSLSIKRKQSNLITSPQKRKVEVVRSQRLHRLRRDMFSPLKYRVVALNPTQSMDVCVLSVFVLSYVDNGFVEGQSPPKSSTGCLYN